MDDVPAAAGVRVRIRWSSPPARWRSCRRRATAIDRRLEELIAGGGGRRSDAQPALPGRWSACVKRVGEKAPRSPKELGNLRLRLVQAGYRRDEALTIFFGIRVVVRAGAVRAVLDARS